MLLSGCSGGKREPRDREDTNGRAATTTDGGIEDSINNGRTAFVTANIAALRGGMPIRAAGQVVGAVGIAGLSKETDVDIANTAAAALGSLPETAGQH